ncbi:MAG: hypothetical protein ACI4KD_04895 [Oscillospiraceae bacterium]
MYIFKERVTDMKIRIFQRDYKILIIFVCAVLLVFAVNAFLRDCFNINISAFVYIFSALAIVAAIFSAFFPTTVTIYDDSIGIKRFFSERKISYKDITGVSIEEYSMSRKSGMTYRSEQRVRLWIKIKNGDSFSRVQLNDSADGTGKVFSDDSGVRMDLYWLCDHLDYVKGE